MLQTNNGSANGSQKRRARPIRKRHRIEQALRRQIVEGEYGPGARLPLRVELERRFAAIVEEHTGGRFSESNRLLQQYCEFDLAELGYEI